MWRNRHAKYFWAAMTHLTPSTISAILNPTGGFAKLSDKIARKVGSSFQRKMTILVFLNAMLCPDFHAGHPVVQG